MSCSDDVVVGCFGDLCFDGLVSVLCGLRDGLDDFSSRNFVVFDCGGGVFVHFVVHDSVPVVCDGLCWFEELVWDDVVELVVWGVERVLSGVGDGVWVDFRFGDVFLSVWFLGVVDVDVCFYV